MRSYRLGGELTNTIVGSSFETSRIFSRSDVLYALYFLLSGRESVRFSLSLLDFISKVIFSYAVATLCLRMYDCSFTS